MKLYFNCLYISLQQKQSSMELHFVHYKASCGRTLGEALANCVGDNDALAVLGVFIEVGDFNEAFEPFAKGSKNPTQSM